MKIVVKCNKSEADVAIEKISSVIEIIEQPHFHLNDGKSGKEGEGRIYIKGSLQTQKCPHCNSGRVAPFGTGRRLICCNCGKTFKKEL